MSGYIQARYNGLFETNPELEVPQMDKNWGADKGISFRRVRVKLLGWLHPRLYMYFQADFAGEPSLRDAYMDVHLLDKKQLWLRVGQSKVPFGYENMQSSSQRIPLDRTDPINSALPNERDLMAVMYFLPPKLRKVYDFLNENNLKHSGDYGAYALGIFNGQGINVPDENPSFHVVARASHAVQFNNKQVLEFSLHAYSGLYRFKETTPDVTTPGAVGGAFLDPMTIDFTDQRIGATFMYYPQPIGIQAEFNIGTGPKYIPQVNQIKNSSLSGGYLMVMGRVNTAWGQVMPFTRYMYYDGGKKFELDARSYLVSDLELGVEWQPLNALEVVLMYSFCDRRYEDALKPNNPQDGVVLRVQMQVNY